MGRYPVLQKRREDDDWETVGYVRAPDREGAAAVPGADSRDVVGATDKSYRVSAGYPLGPKRRRAEQRIADLGVRIEGTRPGVHQ